jgi:hypothetical protein
VPRLTDYEVRQLCATAIAPTYNPAYPATGDNTPLGVNPPAGIWGDTNFARNLATALENIDGVYAVPEMQLKHSITQEPLENLAIAPWNLIEVQQGITFTVIR